MSIPRSIVHVVSFAMVEDVPVAVVVADDATVWSIEGEVKTQLMTLSLPDAPDPE